MGVYAHRRTLWAMNCNTVIDLYTPDKTFLTFYGDSRESG